MGHGLLAVLLLPLLLASTVTLGPYPAQESTVLAVSPFSALLAALHDPSILTAQEREEVSALIFNGAPTGETRGTTHTEPSCWSCWSLCGHRRRGEHSPHKLLGDAEPAVFARYRRFLGVGEGVLLREAQTTRPEIKLIQTKNNDPEFILEKDQVRKFFDAQFSWEYLTQIAVADRAGFAEFDQNLNLLLGVLPDMKVDRVGGRAFRKWIAAGRQGGTGREDDTKVARKDILRKREVDLMEKMLKYHDEENAEIKEAQVGWT